jgi:hypothetical protein
LCAQATTWLENCHVLVLDWVATAHALLALQATIRQAPALPEGRVVLAVGAGRSRIRLSRQRSTECVSELGIKWVCGAVERQ